MNREYWVNRIKKHGHTGWADNLTYIYDQNMRLSLVKNILIKYFNNPVNISLDYGCGSGDFSCLLAKYSNKVIGVDIANEIVEIANANYPEQNIEFSNIDTEIFTNYSYQVINLITVFQHMLDDDKLEEIILNLYNLLADDGIIIIIDSFGLKEKSEYLKSRNYHEFVQLLNKSGFDVLETHNLYHPQGLPTKIFELYSRNYFIRLLNKIKLYSILNKISTLVSNFDNPIVISETGTKLIIARKSNYGIG
ncbi:MAG: hypothetical protein OFPII_24780 [Osedax symbiont Rs1]|nr:MAG: hypothetical protein OFPII_24780 [Osedax symbiont Rs1]